MPISLEQSIRAKTGLGQEEFRAWVVQKISVGYTLKRIAAIFGYNARHLGRICRRLGISKFWQGNEDETVELVRTTMPRDRWVANWGAETLRGQLASSGYNVSRERVARALRVVDPQGVDSRRKRTIRRRQYNITEAMRLWSMDSYDKLAEYGLRVHGIIDGASHYVVAMEVRDNKRAETIFNIYAEAIRQFGRPILVRSDFALEHNLVERDMRAAHPDRQTAFIRGSSTRNQRIERFWRGLFEKVVWYFKYLVNVMEDTGVLKMDSPWHRQSLKESWLPLLQAAVQGYVRAWNYHRVRASKIMPSHVPISLFQAAERLSGAIPPHTSKNIELALEPGLHVEAAASLPEELKQLRNRAFDMNKAGLKEDLIFLLHLDLSLECAAAARAMDNVTEYLRNIEAGNHGHRKKIARMLLLAM